MIEKIIELSIRNRFVVLVIAAALTVAGIFAMLNTPVDAIPDLSENQVIVFTDWMGRSPREIEDQITYPLTVSLQGLPGVRVVRSSSAFGFSMINVIFEDWVDLYFARSRVLERLNLLTKALPAGVVPTLGPDATGVGHVFWYTVEGQGQSLRELRDRPLPPRVEVVTVAGERDFFAPEPKTRLPGGGWELTLEHDGRRPASLDLFLAFLQITEEEFIRIVSTHQVSPHRHDPSKVTPGEPLPDMPLWDRTMVDDVKVGRRSETGAVKSYV
jgi:hypothetical protein